MHLPETTLYYSILFFEQKFYNRRTVCFKVQIVTHNALFLLKQQQRSMLSGPSQTGSQDIESSSEANTVEHCVG